MSSILQKQVNTAATSATLVTTTELQVAYSGRVEATLPTIRAVVKAWANIIAGTGTTSLQMRIRRGNGITGSVLQLVAVNNIAAGAEGEMNCWSSEQLLNVEFQDYSLTVQQVGATANGTAANAQIEVEMING